MISAAAVIVLAIAAALMEYDRKKQVAKAESLRVEQVASATVYTYPGRHKKVLRVIDDPAMLQPLVEAMNHLEDYTPNHPNYSVTWYIVLQLNDGDRVHLECRLMSSPDKNVYMSVFAEGRQSATLYDWLIEHAWEEADAEALDALGGAYNWSVLHRAAKGGHIEIARILLDKGADVNCMGQFGTPLDLAIMESKTQMTRFLRQHGALTAGELAD